MQLAQIVPIISALALVLGIVSTIGGFFFYWSSSVRKRYAAERDFEHIKRNHQQVIEMLTQMDDEMSDLRAEVIRLQADRRSQ
jgi:hypothetical protein